MRLFRVAAFASALCCAGTSHAAVDENTPSLGQTVRLTHEALGCTSYEGLQRSALIVAQQNGQAILAEITAAGCRTYTTMHGEVVDSKGGMVCILGIGNSRCLWFPSGVTEPARRF